MKVFVESDIIICKIVMTGSGNGGTDLWIIKLFCWRGSGSEEEYDEA